ncbi:hypothetical protein M9H77_02473 [Catharanthus roseus]|uniref:Uncharacterized protein n=1 Tax=Catharanthus roseus TaxID=4058 RepID=A0ACC0C8J6_CATRO|nr:hypothetical protein M9H77_02473 [Catharanthus roseus]
MATAAIAVCLYRAGVCSRFLFFHLLRRQIGASGKIIEKCHTGTGIPRPYPGPYRVGSGSRNFIPWRIFNYLGLMNGILRFPDRSCETVLGWFSRDPQILRRVGHLLL